MLRNVRGTLTSSNSKSVHTSIFTIILFGRDREALKLMEECMAVATRILGTTHLNTLSVLITLLQ